MNKKTKLLRAVLFLSIGIISILGGLHYFAKISAKSNVVLLETYFQCPVNGLSIGSAVNYRGVKIGSVKEISFLGAKYDVPSKESRNVYVLMEIDCDICRYRPDEDAKKTVERMIDSGLRAKFCGTQTVKASSIEFIVPEKNIPPARISLKSDYALIPPMPLETVNPSVESGINGEGFKGFDASAVLSNVIAMTQGASQMCNNINSVVESERDRLSRILENLDATASALRVFSETISENPSRLIRARSAEYLPETH